jgi:hypothetical protein
MEQIKKIIEVGCRGLAKDPVSLSEIVTREEKEIYLVSDADCPTYSFLMILSDKRSKKNNHKNLGLYSGVIEHSPKTNLSLDGIFSVKKHHAGGYEAVYLWANSPIEATILYCLGLRVWKKISSDRGDSPAVNSVLDRLRKTDGNNLENEYNIRAGLESLPYGRDVKIIALGSAGSYDLMQDEPSYVIAERIAEANRDMYLRHDSAFDEMHRIAKLFGLSLPANQKDWENKSNFDNK